MKLILYLEVTKGLDFVSMLLYMYREREESSNVNHFLVVNVRTTESALRGGD